jgi:hypothetical protein
MDIKYENNHLMIFISALFSQYAKGYYLCRVK